MHLGAGRAGDAEPHWGATGAGDLVAAAGGNREDLDGSAARTGGAGGWTLDDHGVQRDQCRLPGVGAGLDRQVPVDE